MTYQVCCIKYLPCYLSKYSDIYAVHLIKLMKFYFPFRIFHRIESSNRSLIRITFNRNPLKFTQSHLKKQSDRTWSLADCRSTHYFNIII